MHPDEAVQLAIHDLRRRAPHTVSVLRPQAPSMLARLLRAWLAPLAWYVADGRTPASADPGAVVGHLPRLRLRAEARERERAMDTALAPLALGTCR